MFIKLNMVSSHIISDTIELNFKLIEFVSGFLPQLLLQSSTNYHHLDNYDSGFIHLSAESFNTVPKLWLRILARKNCAKTFGMEFYAKIQSKNFGTVQNFGHVILAC